MIEAATVPAIHVGDVDLPVQLTDECPVTDVLWAGTVRCQRRIQLGVGAVHARHRRGLLVHGCLGISIVRERRRRQEELLQLNGFRGRHQIAVSQRRRPIHRRPLHGLNCVRGVPHFLREGIGQGHQPVDRAAEANSALMIARRFPLPLDYCIGSLSTASCVKGANRIRPKPPRQGLAS